MKWYQIVAIVLLTLSATVHAARHGEPTDAKYNFYTTLVGIGIWLVLLHFGGFWK